MPPPSNWGRRDAGEVRRLPAIRGPRARARRRRPRRYDGYGNCRRRAGARARYWHAVRVRGAAGRAQCGRAIRFEAGVNARLWIRCG
jgi:hypothetical protein